MHPMQCIGSTLCSVMTAPELDLRELDLRELDLFKFFVRAKALTAKILYNNNFC